MDNSHKIRIIERQNLLIIRGIVKQVGNFFLCHTAGNQILLVDTIEALLMFLNPAIRKVYDIYTKRKTGTAAVVPMVTVDAFDTAVSGYYPARKGKYAVEVSSCDDDDDMIIKGNFNGQGDEDIGWFDPVNGKWSDTKPTAQPSDQSENQGGTPVTESENE